MHATTVHIPMIPPLIFGRCEVCGVEIRSREVLHIHPDAEQSMMRGYVQLRVSVPDWYDKDGLDELVKAVTEMCTCGKC